jgi:hypothetical protein
MLTLPSAQRIGFLHLLKRSHTVEWLHSPLPHQIQKHRLQTWLAVQILSKNFHQLLLTQKRRQKRKHKHTLGAFATPQRPALCEL